MEEYMGVIKLWAGNFAPQNWAFCDGSLMSVAQNRALFSLLGTAYGGNGQTTFALPDLRGRMVIAMGSNSQGNTITRGETGGSATAALTTNNMPQHTHSATVVQPQAALTVSSANASQTAATATCSIATPGSSSTGTFVSTFGFAAASGSNVSLNTASLSVTTPAVTNQDTGTGAPFSIVPSYLGMHYIICTNGVYPLPPQSQDKP